MKIIWKKLAYALFGGLFGLVLGGIGGAIFAGMGFVPTLAWEEIFIFFGSFLGLVIGYTFEE